MNKKKLTHSFYMRPTKKVAQDLLGKKLVYRMNSKEVISGIIIETEAYLGVKDPACHSYGGKRTNRILSMYLPGGHCYIYLIYGLHHCFNVVTGSSSQPEAVLIRALKPLEGVSMMIRNRGITNVESLTDGPGKLCKAFNINRELDGESLLGDRIYIEHYKPNISLTYLKGPRVGIGYAGEAAQWPLRYFIKEPIS